MDIATSLSATELARRTAATLDTLDNDDTEEILILKNNSPKAVLMSVDRYQALQEELEDLRLAALGLARLATFGESEAISHAEMMKMFGA